MNFTANLNLKKPEDHEQFDIQDFNSNADVLDEAIEQRIIKNADITPDCKAKIRYDERGLVLGGEDLTPDDIPNISVEKIEGRPPIVYVNGTPVYGCRFIDIDSAGNAVLREDGTGDYLLTVLENGEIILRDVITQVVDTLDSESAEDALSAKQGHILYGWLGKITDLLTTAKSNLVAAVNELFNSLKTHKENTSNPHGVTKAQLGLGNVTNVEQAAKTTLDSHISNTTNPHSVTKTQVGLGNCDNTADADKEVLSATKLKTARTINGVAFNGSANITVFDNTKIPVSQKGAAGGVAELDANGLVPSAQLPSYVDDVIEGTRATFPTSGESGKIYVDTATGLTYRWSGSTYVEISKSLALGETASTAYAGNKGAQNAANIDALSERMATAEDSIGTLETEVATRLPYPVVYVEDTALYPTTFVDVDDTGDAFLREDGSGNYLLYVTPSGLPMLRLIGA